ncbi:MAG: putative anti-sigma regulatory factor, serine/threonine protein kinase [Chloroflexi bacterium]|nr:putative anti-sigma regulatory factor, serine/threonine protein kinase [Chloroflexota bacterium]
MDYPLHIPVATLSDQERARREARRLATARGFAPDAVEAVGLAASELASNLVRHATEGEIVLTGVDSVHGSGVQVESRDDGPGIPDVDSAMQDGFSTSGGLGSGLPGVRRLMDEFEISSAPNGTRVTTRKWPGTR